MAVIEETYIEKLCSEESFQIWNFQLNVVLKANGLFDIVNGESKLEDLNSNEKKDEWKKNDAKAQKLIVMTIDKKWLLHIINSKSSYEMYEKLKNIFQKSTQDQVCNLLQQFYNFTFDKGCDMAIHISKIENLAHKLKALNQAVDDNMIISKILSTLPSQYKHFITAWESTSSQERTLTNLIARLLVEEDRSKEKELDIVAFKSRANFCNICKSKTHNTRECKKQFKCYTCGKVGHMSKNCRSKQERNHCNICKKTNHLEKDCYFKKRQESGTKSRQERGVSFMTEKQSEVVKVDSKFIVDSGSSSHMSNQKYLFNKIEEAYINIKVAKKDDTMQAIGKGEIESSTCTLKDVFYIPELSKNLLSVNAITENDGEVIFTKEKVTVLKDDKEVLVGRKEHGMYIIDLEEHQGLITEKENKDENCKEWHRKLGHPGNTNMKKLIDMVDGINFKKSDLDLEQNCEICIKAKQVRLPFNTVRERASRPLQIIHTDVCGPIDPITWEGKRYILTVLDDYTHFCKVYLMKNKNEVAQNLKEYILEAEASKNIRTSKIRCDNGGEYIQKEFRTWCKNRGIILDYSIIHSPQLNGKAERLNRTLLEKARALIFDSGLDKEMWSEAIYVATYLLNRSPTENMDATPAEKWTGKRPNLSNLQIFGSEAYAKRLGYLKKLESRSEKYIFVGYAPNGYRLWNKDKREISIHRDVIFMKSKLENDETKVKIYIDKEEDLLNQSQNKNVELNEEIELISGEGLEDNIQQSNIDMDISEKITRSGRQIKIPKKFEEFEHIYQENTEYAMLTYQEAVNNKDKEKWKMAIEEEKNSLCKNKTWKYVNRNVAKDRKILSSKWVFRIKESGKYKARLVIRGFEQEYDVDYKETFSPVVNMNCLRILFALAANQNLLVKTFDIKTAFLYGPIDEEIYMEVPEGYDKNNEYVCLLQKSLYGLKQAPLNWNKHFTRFLTSKGLTALKVERSIFKNANSTLFLAIYVDDGLIIGKNEQEIENLLEDLRNEFEMTENNNPTSFLNIEIKRTEEYLALKQEKYVKTILKNFGMENAKSLSTPMVENPSKDEVFDNLTYNSKFDNLTNKSIYDSKPKFPYRECIGSLLYLTNKTRPDIQYAVNICSRRLENPNLEDILNAKRILRYLVDKKNEGICYLRNSNYKQLEAFCDSDFAGDKNTRKSTTGFVIFYCGGPIAWTSRKQPIVSLSSTEAEYIAAADCTKEILYLKTVIEDLIGEEINVELNVDNQSAIKLIKNGQFSKRSKHIDVRYHFIHEKVNEGLLLLKYCDTRNQLADIFTKPLNKVKFGKFKEEIMVNI